MSETGHIDIHYLARLSRLELTAEEETMYAGQLERILGYFEKLQAVDVTGLEPMAHPFPLENVWGEDVAISGFTSAQALANAPAQRENQIVVPKVVEDA